ncbi:MAG: patatin-like phospholipase family protein [Candidatus Obscuribacterales bacterium]|nr:patatin-like phospholipase family protein [Candidatus Obscuribacterales bacterium]
MQADLASDCLLPYRDLAQPAVNQRFLFLSILSSARLFAVCLSLGSLLSISPIAAFADGGTGTPELRRAANSSDSITTPRPLIGLALGGGGTRGAAHVTIIRELERAGIPIDFIAGTSMGAIVGGLYSAGVSTEVLERKFKDQSLMKSFMTVPLWMRVAIAPILFVPRLVGHKPYDGLYYGNKFRHYLDQSVPQEGRKIEDLRIRFSAVALNIADGTIAKLSTGNLASALQASSAVPGLRKPVQIENELYVDGGVSVNLPVRQVREMGASFVIAVCVDERIKRIPLDNFRKVGSVAQRVVSLQLQTIDKEQGQVADVLIHPQVDGIGLISTKPSDAVRAMDAGTEAIKEAMPRIKEGLAARGLHLGLAGIGNYR